MGKGSASSMRRFGAPRAPAAGQLRYRMEKKMESTIIGIIRLRV